MRFSGPKQFDGRRRFWPQAHARPVKPSDENTAALRAFDAAVLADERFTATILPLGDGLLIASWRG